jgi:2-polyprenyl-3-methyl-5-hydroxy-6-metoxy-1,4-benzoquinol methylase
LKRKHSSDEMLDPVAAYNRIAPVFHDVSIRRKAYLEKIEELVIERVPEGSQSLLDIGSGDGKRALRIIRAAGIKDAVLLEPSAKMRERLEASCEIWPIRAEEMKNMAERKFDVIACLWNVLGHIPTAKRRDVLEECGRMLLPDGMLFVDVNHRYNMHAYGFWRTVGRVAYDRILPAVDHGDVIVHWKLDQTKCKTYGHVFRQREMQNLIAEAGLRIEEKKFVDYESGEIQHSGLRGNLFYSLRRAA